MAGDQSANANNLVQKMLGKIRPEGLPGLRLGRVADTQVSS
jgi:hypothetical protein